MIDYATRIVMEEKLIEQIKKHEGYKSSLYTDSKGILTGGFGHAFLHGSSMPQNIWEQIFYYDFFNAKDDVTNLIMQRGLLLSEVRRCVLIEMMFNLGMTKMLRFKNMLFALERQDYKTVVQEMKNSKWYSEVKDRAVKLCKQMEEDRL
jgi:lysozyme